MKRLLIAVSIICIVLSGGEGGIRTHVSQVAS